MARSLNWTFGIRGITPKHWDAQKDVRPSTCLSLPSFPRIGNMPHARMLQLGSGTRLRIYNNSAKRGTSRACLAHVPCPACLERRLSELAFISRRVLAFRTGNGKYRRRCGSGTAGPNKVRAAVNPTFYGREAKKEIFSFIAVWSLAYRIFMMIRAQMCQKEKVGRISSPKASKLAQTASVLHFQNAIFLLLREGPGFGG